LGLSVHVQQRPTNKKMPTTKKIKARAKTLLTLDQWVIKLRNARYDISMKLDNAFNTLVYARDGIKKNKPDGYDWAKLLEVSENNYAFYKHKLDQAEYEVKTAAKSYAFYVSWETEYIPR
jgi:hypothetical protein